jgi:hypothetical protein
MVTAPTYGSASADTGVGPQPKNQIVVSGKPDVQYLNIETATNCYPGRLVKKGTHDNDLVVCTAGAAAIGVLGYEQAAKMYRPATRDTIYVQNDKAPVLSGKAVVLLYLVQSQTVVKGDKLVAAADGMVSKASPAAIPNSSTPVTSTSAQPTVTGPISTEGIALAEAEESVTTVDVEGWIMARLLI